MINKSASLKSAVATFTVASVAAPAGISYPATLTQTKNTGDFVTNLATQSAVVPFLTIPAGWMFSTWLFMNWVSGAPAAGTSNISFQLYDVTNNSLGGPTCILANSQLAANQPRAVPYCPPINLNLTTGAEYRQFSLRLNNTDANSINVFLLVAVSAWKIV